MMDQCVTVHMPQSPTKHWVAPIVLEPEKVVRMPPGPLAVISSELVNHFTFICMPFHFRVHVDVVSSERIPPPSPRPCAVGDISICAVRVVSPRGPEVSMDHGPIGPIGFMES